MKRSSIILLLAAAVLLGRPAWVEEFTLNDGRVLTGEVVRRTPTKVTIQNATGVGSYAPEDFAPTTRDRLFTPLAQAVATEQTGRPPHPGSKETRAWSNLAPTEKLQLVCVVLGGLAIVVAEVWFVIAAFSVSAAWGAVIFIFGGLRTVVVSLAMIAGLVFWTKALSTSLTAPPIAVMLGFALLTGCWGVIFIFRHWRQSAGPVSVEVTGIALLIISAAIQSMRGIQ